MIDKQIARLLRKEADCQLRALRSKGYKSHAHFMEANKWRSTREEFVAKHAPLYVNSSSPLTALLQSTGWRVGDDRTRLVMESYNADGTVADRKEGLSRLEEEIVHRMGMCEGMCSYCYQIACDLGDEPDRTVEQVWLPKPNGWVSNAEPVEL
jgi:hypothetical protein